MNAIYLTVGAIVILFLAIFADKTTCKTDQETHIPIPDATQREIETRNGNVTRAHIVSHTTITAQLYGYTGEYYNETTGVHIQCLIRMRTPEDVHDFIEYQLTK